jgi:hypothetical protein
VDLYSKALSKASKDLATSGASGQYIAKLLEGVEPFEKMQNVVNDLNSKLAAGVITAEQRDQAMELAREDLLKGETKDQTPPKVNLSANQYGSVAAYQAELAGQKTEEDRQQKLLTENNKQNERANQQREEMLAWFRTQQTQRFEVFG